MRSFFLFSVMVFALSCGDSSGGRNNTVTNGNRNADADSKLNIVPQYSVQIVATHPHDPKAFTQGLVFHNGFLYEGTGGKPARGDDFSSSLRKVEIESGKVVQQYDVPRDFFGEGIAILGDKIYQLTWQERTGFVYGLDDFKLLKEVRYSGEGWGLTHDGTNLIMSDGTHVIRFVNPENFTTVRTIAVNDEKGDPLMEINELEFIKGEIWANVWQTGWIVRIDPATGKLLGRIDLNSIAQDERKKSKNSDVLNGIAHDPATDRIFVTGKNWPRLYEIKVNAK
ncbi:MAG TPA: glutaminyl-peptide cyclotransferase [Pyrinomonadaceae bacterium]|jgi:glutamine cyclotransferase|nr:glutaminyl-peptide cyclotransferase [Pyrinomonadaceae bacterium]